MSLNPVVQSVTCKSRNLSRNPLFKGLSKCHVCEDSKSSAGGCRFIDCRTIVPPHAAGETSVTFTYTNGSPPHYPLVFNRKFTLEDIQSKRRTCASLLLPILLNESTHHQQPNLIIHSQEIDERVTCDICNTALFSQTWICHVCGRELCQLCYDAIKEGHLKPSVCSIALGLIHAQSNFYPISRFHRDEIAVEISMMESLLNHSPRSYIKEHPSIKVPKLARNVPLSEFLRYWSQGIPVLVTGVDARLQGDWGPHYFIERYGSHKVTLVDCETDCMRQTTVSEFFQDFNGTGERGQILKLKDWPPQAHFRDKFPELFHAFMEAVPFGDVTRLDGVLNMAAHFPINGVAPDLGPKMYIAYGSIEDGQHHGSTKLHIDMTDAINVMVWASGRTEPQNRYALWRIFPQAASPAICEFLRDQAGFTGPGHPIHSQTAYFTEAMLMELEALYSVRPFTIRQRTGDAIFIPAGCAHQVSNQTDAIKIACDFISIENILQTQRICTELQQHRLATGIGEDVLQFYTTLWHAWRSLTYDKIFEDITNTASITPRMESRNLADHVLRKKERKRALKMRKVAERPYRPGYNFSCPLCPRMFHRAGLLDHLKSTHPAYIDIDGISEARLRKPRVVADDNFMQQLKSFIQDP